MFQRVDDRDRTIIRCRKDIRTWGIESCNLVGDATVMMVLQERGLRTIVPEVGRQRFQLILGYWYRWYLLLVVK